jgi:plasmid stabilization system protein ParE
MTTFDALGLAEDWEKAGLSPEQARKMAAALRDRMQDTLATRQDLGNLRADLREEMAELRAALRREMAELRGELRAEMAELRGELRQEMADMRGELR